MARKLRDRLAVAAGLNITEEPQVKVPAADKTQSLAEAAREGLAAINALYAERNDSVELAADLNQKLNHVQAINVGLRDEKNYYQQQCVALIKANARLGAYLAQARDLFSRIASETQQVTAAIENMPQPAPISNNPDLPRINSVGLPVEEERREPQFDKNGLPYNGAATKSVSPEELASLINRLEDAPLSLEERVC